MATEYTVNKIGDNHEICRDGELVATYNEVIETTTYAGTGKKYAVPISKQIAAIKGGRAPFEIEKVKEATAKIMKTSASVLDGMTTEGKSKLREAIIDSGLATDKKDNKIKTLEAHVTSLQLEIEDLKRQIATGGKAPHVRDRFAGVPVDHPEAPEKDKFLGIYTPAYIEWARSFWKPEQFTKIYKDKYPAPAATIEEITK